MRIGFAFCICSAIAVCCVSAIAIAAPTTGHWIPAGQVDLARDGWRRESNVGYLSARLDMDGDGHEDEAVLVTSTDGARSGVRICLNVGAPQSEARCHMVGVGPNTQSIMGLDRRAPGCFRFVESERTGAADGRMCTKTDVLEYFRFGGSASIFRYDPMTGMFDRYWSSD